LIFYKSNKPSKLGQKISLTEIFNNENNSQEKAKKFKQDLDNLTWKSKLKEAGETSDENLILMVIVLKENLVPLKLNSIILCF
jgi:hypothetical protein